MRVLTVRQPWAWAIIHGGKNVENRSQNIAGTYRGPVAIHVSRTKEPIQADYSVLVAPIEETLRNRPADDTGGFLPWEKNFGAIIGVVDLIEVHSAAKYPRGISNFEILDNGQHELCSPWAQAYVAHHLVFANPRPLAEPIPAKGRLGLWKPDPELLKRIEEQL